MKKLKGFTLVELIVVIGIIGVLGSLLVINGMRWINESKIASQNAESKLLFNSIQTVVQDYNINNKDKIVKAQYTSSYHSYHSTILPVFDEFFAYYDGKNMAITHYGKLGANFVQQKVVSVSSDGNLITGVSDGAPDYDLTFEKQFLKDVKNYYAEAGKYRWAVYVKDYLVQQVVLGEGAKYFGSYPATMTLDNFYSIGTTVKEIGEGNATFSFPGGSGKGRELLSSWRQAYDGETTYVPPTPAGSSAPNLEMKMKGPSPNP
ncbi:MAG: type II secretion system GspH family protein [Oscillospiraceae bacterium]|jgi:prepilin-type N-terminal cleavage/methylation domain-containing protein|nr:type II secretion system GspH family protein [Oscillospiraceae bacterium]